MRAIAFATAVLAGCATAPPQLGEGDTIETLTSSQVERAFQGRAACAVYPEDGACETIDFLEARSGDVLTFRTVGASDIETITTDNLAGVVRSLRMFDQYNDLFGHLAAERARGGFRYLKTVTMSRGVLDTTVNRWCTTTSPSEAFERVDFYFSNNLFPDISADVRLSPESERRLRSFLRGLAADEEFRMTVEATADTPASLQEVRQTFAMFAGATECWSYSAVVQGGQLDLTSAQPFVDGQAASHLNRTVRMVSQGETLTLRAN